MIRPTTRDGHRENRARRRKKKEYQKHTTTITNNTKRKRQLCSTNIDSTLIYQKVFEE